MALNVSRMQLYQTCPQKYAWMFVENLEPKWDGIARPVGSAVHEAVAALYAGKTRAEANAVAMARYFKDIPAEWKTLETKVQQEVIRGEAQVRAMVEFYPWALEERENVAAIEQEIEFKVAGQKIKGRVDRLLRVNGGLWLHDTKTTGLDIAKVVKVQRLRVQYDVYTIGVEQVMKEKLAGVMLDVIQKPGVYFKKTGELSSVGEPAFLREPMHKSERRLAEAERWVTRQVGAIEMDKASGEWLKNSESCFAYNRTCPYIDLCTRPEWQESMRGLFKVREKDYTEEGE